MEKLTVRQDEILDYIKKYKAKHGYPPTIREICTALNKRSSATVHAHLNNLEKKGYIKKDNFKNRSIELLVTNNYEYENQNVSNIPLIEKITTDDPMDAIEKPEKLYSIPSTIIPKNKGVFAIQVKDDSMIKVGIFKGDIAIIQVQRTANDKDIVVAINDKKELTLKTYYRDELGIRLQPENDSLKPIIIKKVNILGKMIGLYRKI